MARPPNDTMNGNMDSQFTNNSDNSPQIINAHGQDTIELPSTEFVADADMSRDGQDLILETADGSVVVIEGYFNADPAPLLEAPGGQALTPELVESFAHQTGPVQYANESIMSDESPVGSVQELSGNATVVRTNGVTEEITIGTPIFQGDIIETDEEGAVNIEFIDETTFAVSENARLAVDEYVYDPETESGASNFSILRGVFVFTSGLIGRDDPDDVTIDTPVGSIGIRGTTIAGEINPDGESKITIVEGVIIVRNGNGEETLSDPFGTLALDGYNSDMNHIGTLDADTVNNTYGTLQTVAPELFLAASDDGNMPDGGMGDDPMAAGNEGPDNIAPEDQPPADEPPPEEMKAEEPAPEDGTMQDPNQEMKEPTGDEPTREEFKTADDTETTDTDGTRDPVMDDRTTKDGTRDPYMTDGDRQEPPPGDEPIMDDSEPTKDPYHDGTRDDTKFDGSNDYNFDGKDTTFDDGSRDGANDTTNPDNSGPGSLDGSGSGTGSDGTNTADSDDPDTDTVGNEPPPPPFDIFLEAPDEIDDDYDINPTRDFLAKLEPTDPALSGVKYTLIRAKVVDISTNSLVADISGAVELVPHNGNGAILRLKDNAEHFSDNQRIVFTVDIEHNGQIIRENFDIKVFDNGDLVINGTAGADTSLNGGAGDDFIDGKAGNDTINGQAGHDDLFGGDGNDTFLVDNSIGDDGHDFIDGGNGFDIYDASTVPGTDNEREYHLHANNQGYVIDRDNSEGDEFVSIEQFLAGEDDDIFIIEDGLNGSTIYTIDGGTDTVSTPNPLDVDQLSFHKLSGDVDFDFTGTDKATTSTGGQVFFSNIESFVGSQGDDNFTMNSAFEDGLDFNGLNGFDTYDASAMTSVTLKFDVSTGTIKELSGGMPYPTQTISNIENFIGSLGADTFLTSDGDGDQTYDGVNGSDTYDASAASGDVIFNFMGSNNVMVHHNGDQDTVFNVDHFTGNGTDSKIDFGGVTSAVTVDLTTGTVSYSAESYTVDGITEIIGSAHDDNFTGDNDTEIIKGMDGNDSISAGKDNSALYGDGGLGAGTDVLNDGGHNNVDMFGGGGNDTLRINGSRNDTTLGILDGGDGIDTLVLDSVSSTLDFSSVAADKLSDIEIFELSQDSQTLILRIDDIINLMKESHDSNTVTIDGTSTGPWTFQIEDNGAAGGGVGTANGTNMGTLGFTYGGTSGGFDVWTHAEGTLLIDTGANAQVV